MEVEGLRTDMHQDYNPMNIDYSGTSNGHSGDHEYSSLHDMIDVDVNSNIESMYPQMDVAVGKPDVSSSTSDFFSNHSVHSSGIQLPPISSAQPNIDLDSSVSNLSWLHSMQQQMPATNGNPNLMVNPSTVTPISSPQSLHVVTLPSNVHISNSGNIKYVTVPTSKQQVYISTTKSTMSTSQYYAGQAKSTIAYQRNYSHSPGSTPTSTVPDNPFPKPAYSYSCLIALSLKNSRRGSLPVAEIYNFMMQNFPYFKTAPDGWKNSVRHNLSLNKCFEKIENPNSDGTHSRKGCLWAMNPTKIKKMDEEVAKWNKKDLIAIKRSMSNPDLLDTLTSGQGAYLMERSRPIRHSYQTSHLVHRPGVRIVTAIQPPHSNTNTGHQHITIGQGQILDRQHYADHIDLNKLAEDAADIFGESDDFVLDPSLSDLGLQNSTLEEFTSDLLDFTSLSGMGHAVAPMTTNPIKHTQKQIYNNNSVLPIY